MKRLFLVLMGVLFLGSVQIASADSVSITTNDQMTHHKMVKHEMHHKVVRHEMHHKMVRRHVVHHKMVKHVDHKSGVNVNLHVN